MSDNDLVQMEDRGAYGFLRINRAEKRNAMSRRRGARSASV